MSKNLEEEEISHWGSAPAGRYVPAFSLPSPHSLLLPSQVLRLVFKEQQKVQTSFILLLPPATIRAPHSLGQKAGPIITVLDTVSDCSRNGPMTQPGPSKTRRTLSLLRSCSCLWQREAGLSREGVRRNEAHKE